MGFYAPLLVFLALALGGAFWKGYTVGVERNASEVTDLRVALNTSRAEADRAEERARETAGRVQTVYRDRIKTVREAAPPPEVIERVIVEAKDCPAIPAAYISLWNDTPAGSPALTNPPGANATWGDLAEATVEAKRRFEENRARLDALQELVKAQ